MTRREKAPYGTCERCLAPLDERGVCPPGERARAERIAQGLPPTIEDPETLRRIWTIVAEGLRETADREARERAALNARSAARAQGPGTRNAVTIDDVNPEQRARRAAEKVRHWTAERDDAIRAWRKAENATYKAISDATKLSQGGVDRVLKRGD